MFAVGGSAVEGVGSRSGWERNQCLVERLSLLGHGLQRGSPGCLAGVGEYGRTRVSCRALLSPQTMEASDCVAYCGCVGGCAVVLLLSSQVG
jgi:hypothetical protein